MERELTTEQRKRIAQASEDFGVDVDRILNQLAMSPLERLEKHYRAVRNVMMIREAANSRRPD